MKIITPVLRGVLRLKLPPELSREASKRLKWFDYYERCGHNARLTCRHFGISPQTFYRWKKRYDPRHLESLEDRSHRPRQVRQPTYTQEEVKAVLKMREQYPRWGKDKLAVLLRREGCDLSASTVGRILCYLKTRGLLKEPVSNYVSSRKRQRNRPYAIRKPKEYVARAPGDIVQVDTMDIRPLPGVILKHFTAHDVISKWDVIDAYSTATATTASRFLDSLVERMPFPLKAIQVDGGSEYEAAFETEWERGG